VEFKLDADKETNALLTGKNLLIKIRDEGEKTTIFRPFEQLVIHL
jgi:hypothetical protein